MHQNRKDNKIPCLPYADSVFCLETGDSHHDVRPYEGGYRKSGSVVRSLVREHIPWVLIAHLRSLILCLACDLSIFLPSQSTFVARREIDAHESIDSAGHGDHGQCHGMTTDKSWRLICFIEKWCHDTRSVTNGELDAARRGSFAVTRIV